MAYGQDNIDPDSIILTPGSTITNIPDTITLSVTHQTLLPQLIGQQAWLNSLKQPGALDAALADIAEKINILLTAYIEQERIQPGKIQLGPDGKSIIVK